MRDLERQPNVRRGAALHRVFSLRLVATRQCACAAHCVCRATYLRLLLLFPKNLASLRFSGDPVLYYGSWLICAPHSLFRKSRTFTATGVRLGKSVILPRASDSENFSAILHSTFYILHSAMQGGAAEGSHASVFVLPRLRDSSATLGMTAEKGTSREPRRGFPFPERAESFRQIGYACKKCDFCARIDL